jgi:arylsulfatase
VAASYPEVVDQLRKSYDKWWASTLPLMINEGLPKLKEQPLAVRYERQLKEKGIPEWSPPEI